MGAAKGQRSKQAELRFRVPRHGPGLAEQVGAQRDSGLAVAEPPRRHFEPAPDHPGVGERIPQLAREALEEMRLSVRGLAGKPVRLDDAFADWRAEIVARLEQAKVEAAWEHPGDGIARMLPARVFMQLTRVLREAVSNVIKHSEAKHCRVRFTIDDEWLRVIVKDDGRGISADLHRGQGMSSMKRRAKKMNGQCLVESRPGSGVVISLTVPL